MLNLKPEQRLVWYLIDEKFRKLNNGFIQKIDWQRFRWKIAISYAMQNYSLFEFCNKIRSKKFSIPQDKLPKYLRRIDKLENSGVEELKRSLKLINEIWVDKIHYYLIKTSEYDIYDDVDVLFESKEYYNKAINLMIKKGFKYKQDEFNKGSIIIKNGVKIEPHLGISWFGMKAFDNDFMVKNNRKIELFDLTFRTISEKANFALSLGHQILDVTPTTIGSFVHTSSFMERFTDWEPIINQTEKHGWKKALVYHLSAWSNLYKKIYGKELIFQFELPEVNIRFGFPFWIPIHKKFFFVFKKLNHDQKNGFKVNFWGLQRLLRVYTWARIEYDYLRKYTRPQLITGINS